MNDLWISIEKTNGILHRTAETKVFQKMLPKHGNQLSIKADNQEAYLHLLNVAGTLVYKVVFSIAEVGEYNPSLALQNSENSFWTVNETEYKIDLKGDKKFSFETFKGLFEDCYFGGVETGCVETTNSFERYIEVESPSAQGYFVLLGKKGWKKEPAIKYKQPRASAILTREVSIKALNKENLIETIENLGNQPIEDTQLRQYPAFYKRKDRVVCIHQETGFIYGLSYSEAKTMGKSVNYFNQIEIEFWSQMVDLDKIPQNYWQLVEKNHFELIDLIERRLRSNGFKYKAPGRKKHEWLSGIGTNKTLTIEQIV